MVYLMGATLFCVSCASHLTNSAADKQMETSRVPAQADEKVLSIITAAEMRTKLKRYCEDEDSNGVCYMTFALAEEYCAAQGSRLFSAREFAEIAVSRGARRITGTKPETSYSTEISTKNADGTTEKFYLDHAGAAYQRPSQEPGDLCVWSSSRHSIQSNRVYSFNNNTGLFSLRNAVQFSSNPAPSLCAATCVNTHP
jgi:hypothetical protein